jgi:hypothetical protein
MKSGAVRAIVGVDASSATSNLFGVENCLLFLCILLGFEIYLTGYTFVPVAFFEFDRGWRRFLLDNVPRFRLWGQYWELLVLG